MAFKNDIFISYAHLDNKPLSKTDEGWITRFHETLAAMLNTRIGREPEIWRDKKLTGNDMFGDVIVEQFPYTALLISIITPRYVESEWCTKEAREFCKTAESTGGVIVDNKSRILKVVKFPGGDEDPLPEPMKNALGYEFYVFNDETPLELDEAYGEKFKQTYNMQVAKLAFDVAQLIKKLASQPPAASQPASTRAKPVVFLADCSGDRHPDRNAILADLRLAGYSTLPDEKLPDDEEGFIGRLDKLLGRSKLSVHIVGSGYGVVPDGPSEKSVGVLANERATQHSRTSGLKRIIWVPSGTEPRSENQKLFVKSLLEDTEAQYGADLINGNIEDLKRAIHSALKKIEDADVPHADKPALFLAECGFDRRVDREAIMADLRGAGYPILPEVQLPTEEASYFGALATILGQCKLSVHIVGNNYGVVPDGPSESSVSVLANELAAQYSKKAGLKRLIWVPGGTKSSSRRQQEFIDSLRIGSDTMLGAELVSGSLEDVKASIRAALKNIETADAVPAAQEPQQSQQPATTRKVIYLICDETDREATMPLRIFLRKQGYDTRIPAFKGDAATVRQSNLDILTACDAAIIFYGVKEDSWKRSVDAEILKAAGNRTSKPPLEPFTYLAQPESDDKKELIELEEPRIINCLSGHSDAALGEFVSTVSGAPKP
jgi:hypothetical protein